MIIEINGKRVWPKSNSGSIYGYNFEESDGRLVYTETPLDNKGRPDKNRHAVVIELSQGELERLVVVLSREHYFESPRIRTEIQRALRNLEKTGKDEPR